jgi:hypothetical protein
VRRRHIATSLQLTSIAVAIVLGLSGCAALWIARDAVVGGKGADPDASISWAKTTSAEINAAVNISTPPLATSSEPSVCTAVDYSDQTWDSYEVMTIVPISSSDRQPILDRVTAAFKDRKGWTVLGDDPGEIGGSRDVEKYNRDLRVDGAVDDQGASVEISPDPWKVTIIVRSACYVVKK